MSIKDILCSIIGLVGAAITTLFGGWNAGMTTLIVFMCIDYITGIALAAVFHKSKKTKSGALKSIEGWKGLVRKCVTFLFVIIAYRLDVLIGTTYIKDAVIIAFIVNETISIIENAGLMGVPLPPVIINAVDVLIANADSLSKGDTQ